MRPLPEINKQLRNMKMAHFFVMLTSAISQNGATLSIPQNIAASISSYCI